MQGCHDNFSETLTTVLKVLCNFFSSIYLQLVSRPPFDVQITKKSGKKLRFFCEFTAQEPDFEEVEPQEKIGKYHPVPFIRRIFEIQISNKYRVVSASYFQILRESGKCNLIKVS
jgi:hypothetical protein